jgi:hypothetical protein
MLVFNPITKKSVIDPHYWTIIPFKRIRDSEKDYDIAECKLMWIYHMYNPHSPFKDYRNRDKSAAIVAATFPKSYIEEKEKQLQAKIDEAVLKNQELDALSDTVVEGSEVVPRKKPHHHHVPTLKIYDPLEEKLVQEAAEWYHKEHLKKTPLWYSCESYKESMYNLADIIRDPRSSAPNIRAASQELDTIPNKMEKMKVQAIKDEAATLQIAGDKNIKRGERVESYISRRTRRTAQPSTE